MKKKQTELTDLQKVNKALKALKPNVTATDRKKALELYSEPTVILYLNGKGKDLEIATVLLELFAEAISKRTVAMKKTLTKIAS